MKLSIEKISNDIKNQKTTATIEIEKAYKRIEDTKDYNVFVSLCKDSAVQKAKEIDLKICKGETVGPLAGVPFAVKDNFMTLSGTTTASSKMLKDFSSPYQATAVSKLEAAGAIMIGKTNLDAFAHGGSTETSYFGTTLNPYDKTKVAGGSSGGSAAAVALNIVPFALGSDTGGSIRQPASFCGVSGFKPTYGMISRYGVVAMASSTDVVGPIASSSRDLEIVSEIMAGKDDKDPTSLPNYFKPTAIEAKTTKIGLIKQFMGEGIDKEVYESTKRALNNLGEEGALVEEVDLNMLKYALAIYYIVVPAEISSNLARYDGVRYGFRENSNSVKEMFEKTRALGFSKENIRRIMIGSYVLSSGYYDAYYLKAQKARTLLINEFNKLFEEYDFLVGPVSPTTAFQIGEKTSDPLSMYLSDIMTVGASLAGLPASSVPIGKDNKEMPIGLQIIGKSGNDNRVLAMSKLVEETTK